MRNAGMVQVQFKLSASGDFISPRIVVSSGNSLLDDAALVAVHKSKSVGVPPEDFKRLVTLQIEFNLKD